jgi:hypothetical protein
MTLAEFCVAEGLEAADKFAVEIYRQSGELDREWQAWAERHGDDSDEQWNRFVRYLHDDLMDAGQEQ